MFFTSTHALVASNVHTSANGGMATMDAAAHIPGDSIGSQSHALNIRAVRTKHDNLVVANRLNHVRRHTIEVINLRPVKGNAVGFAADTTVKARIGHSLYFNLYLMRAPSFFHKFSAFRPIRVWLRRMSRMSIMAYYKIFVGL